MIYDQALEYIHTRNMYAKKDGLKNITALCNKLGNPQDKLKVIHIAGTNGKGSVAAYIANSLKAAGYRVGSCISPFIVVFNERIQINGEYISDDDLAKYTTHLADTGVAVTEFEFVTALAFLYFAEKGCDYVVLECGMGGRFDATNVVKSPVASVITLIDFDHMSFLGDTIQDIAWHKCGIIKENSKVYSYMPQNEDALAVIKQTANDKTAQLLLTSNVTDVQYNINKTTFNYKGEKWQVAMKGSFQPNNAALAIDVLNGMGTEKECIKRGISTAFQPCRFQIVKSEPYLIFDGAHNISGCKALAQSIRTYLKTKPVIVFGMADDKQYEECIKLLAPLASRFIVTGFENYRSLDVNTLKGIAKKYCSDVECIKSISEINLVSINTDTIICGSLYLVSEAAKQVGI